MSTVNNGPQIVRNGVILDLDAGYMRSYSPNVMPNPTNIFAWSGTGNNNCTLSGDSTITRQYGSIPLKMVMTGTDPYTGTYNNSSWNLAPAASGQTWTLSFYAKSSETVTGNCFIFGAPSSGIIVEAPSTFFTVTTSWQRFTFTTTLSNASTAFIQMRFGGSSGQVGKTIWWDGVQLERASSATPFNPYYFGNTVWKDVSGNNRTATLTNGPLFNSSNGGNIIFDGVDDYVITPSGGSYSEYTFMFFCKWITDTAASSRLFGCDAFGTYTVFNPSNVGFHYNQSAGSSTTISSGVNVGLGTWCHVAVTVSTLSSIAYIYINGSLTNGSSSIPYINLSGNLFLGAQNTGAGVLANCNISVFQFYNRVLSATEISQNFQADKTRFGL
jgi:hypothetical protein